VALALVEIARAVIRRALIRRAVIRKDKSNILCDPLKVALFRAPVLYHWR
jgi:hypothetical protein